MVINRLFGSNSKTAHRARKIEAAVGACHLFVRKLHREGVDHGAVVSFGNDCRLEVGFTTQEAQIHAALLGVQERVLKAAEEKKGEGTLLYDSLPAVARFLGPDNS